MNSEATRLKLIINVCVLSIALYGISQKSYRTGEASTFERIIIGVFSPIQGGITSMKKDTYYFFKNYFLLVDVSKKNKDLSTKIMSLEERIFSLEEVERENDRLKELLEFGADIEHKKVLAQVVGWNSSSKFKMLRVNKGSKDGVLLRSPVVTSQGLVGYVYRTTDFYSDILTILDQSNRVDSLVDRTRSHGIVEGFSDTRCIMKYVTRTEPVELNDKILTSGLSKIYPKGIKVGKISKIERESYGITQFIEIIPSVEFGRLEEVIILLPSGRKKIGEKKVSPNLEVIKNE